jgi:voltage-gated potassium channel
MSTYSSFLHSFLHTLSKIQGIIFGLFGWLVIDAAAIAYFEKMPFSDALYFTFITGLTIGYGDIAPVTHMGRIIAILTGFVGLIITGLIAAIAVFALRQTLEPPPDSH